MKHSMLSIVLTCAVQVYFAESKRCDCCKDLPEMKTHCQLFATSDTCNGPQKLWFSMTCKKSCNLCNPKSCACGQKWGPWSPWKRCSKTCGGGIKNRTRKCIGGANCSGKSKQTRKCNKHRCKDPKWSPWSSWEICNKKCGGGVKTRTRKCTGRVKCPGKSKQTQKCNTHRCQDPKWSPWSSWEVCNKKCGGGVKTRTRKCTGRVKCPGKSKQTQKCNTHRCQGPMWRPWSSWGRCNAKCGSGNKQRRRKCVGGSDCKGKSKQARRCNTQRCKGSQGNWLNWSNWSKCDVECGSGKQRRTRDCSSQGACTGNSQEVKHCNKTLCNVQWSECSKTCGNGTRSRRACATCVGEFEDCYLTPCHQQTCQQNQRQRYGVMSYTCCSVNNDNTCGVNWEIQGRIVGGSEARPTRWPWMAILDLSTVSGPNICGGVLISNSFILTAAHCISEISTNVTRIRFGTTSLHEQNSSSHVQSRIVERLWIHPLYSDFTSNDIALIKLNRPTIIGAVVSPICLPQGEEVAVDAWCVATGWGTRGPGTSPSSSLQEIGLRILSMEVCRQAYGSFLPSTFSEEQYICAGTIGGGVDTCAGDSGGPLVCQRCSSCQWFVVGITSFGSSQCGAANKPGMYAKVEHYKDWINNVTNSAIASGSTGGCSV